MEAAVTATCQSIIDCELGSRLEEMKNTMFVYGDAISHIIDIIDVIIDDIEKIVVFPDSVRLNKTLQQKKEDVDETL